MRHVLSVVHLLGQKHKGSIFGGCATQPCLGGDGKTLMFVNINCEPASVKETLCSLRFAAKVNQCETGAKGGARKHITELTSDPTARSAQAGPAEVQATAEYTLQLCVPLFVHCLFDTSLDWILDVFSLPFTQ